MLLSDRVRVQVFPFHILPLDSPLDSEYFNLLNRRLKKKSFKKVGREQKLFF